MKNEFIFGVSPVCAGKPFFVKRRHDRDPAVALSGKDVAPLPQQLRWIDAVFAPEEPGELGRTAEAVLGGDPGQRLGLAGTQHLRSRLFQSGLLQYPHRGGAPETAKRNLQRGDTAARCLGGILPNAHRLQRPT
jgi:hypothetical protein